jgi:glyoxylase I family protein
VRALGIHHVNITVADLGAALAFYTDRLGFTPRTDRPDLRVDGAWLDIGPQQIHLIVGAVPDRHSDHFAVVVEDLDATIAELREAGEHVSDAMGVGTARQAFLRDPWNNLIELHEPARGVGHV